MNPKELLAHVASRSGVLDEGGVRAFIDAHAVPPPVSIRLNRAKWQGDVPANSVPWASDAFYLSQRPTFTFDPLFHAGAYYVQEAGSMFLEAAVRACGLAGSDCMALDLCAAPGGKSTHLLSTLGDGAVLVSNEVVRQRARVLCDNITKWGRTNVCVTGSDPSLFRGLRGFFDLVVVDAPCSGEGLFRKDADAMLHWSEEAVEHCAHRQAGILADAWATLRDGGHLIYSTCTYNRHENEEQVARLLSWGAECVEVPLAASWGVMEVREGGVRGYRFMPHLAASEGFFLSVVRKPGADRGRSSLPKGALTQLPERDFAPWMQGMEAVLVRQGDAVAALSHGLLGVLPTLGTQVHVLQRGMLVGQEVRGQFLAVHGLAMKANCDASGLESVDTDLAEAIHYLRGNALLATDARGHALVHYRGLALGLVKGAGNRWNNLYPDPLRIRDMRTSLSEVLTAPL
jgi:16S rRNA C967 or C1407 C5-methylase (RsmB/RsmF family)/NOL1/NOP2/fmu family ribosome biogenesis protein